MLSYLKPNAVTVKNEENPTEDVIVLLYVDIISTGNVKNKKNKNKNKEWKATGHKCWIKLT